MITSTVLAKKNNGKNTCFLLKVSNDENEQFQFKINDNILWYFNSKIETVEGFCIEEPPFGISKGKYMIALEILMEIFKVV